MTSNDPQQILYGDFLPTASVSFIELKQIYLRSLCRLKRYDHGDALLEHGVGLGVIISEARRLFPQLPELLIKQEIAEECLVALIEEGYARLPYLITDDLGAELIVYQVTEAGVADDAGNDQLDHHWCQADR